MAEAIFSDKAVDGMRPVRALIRLADKYSEAILAQGLDLLALTRPAEHPGQLRFRFQREVGYFNPPRYPDTPN